jgi:hypothetical protein
MPLSVTRTEPTHTDFKQYLCNSVAVKGNISMATLILQHSFLKILMSCDVSGEHIAIKFVKGMQKKINSTVTAKNSGESHLVKCVFFCHWSIFFLDIVWGQKIYVYADMHDVSEVV